MLLLSKRSRVTYKIELKIKSTVLTVFKNLVEIKMLLHIQCKSAGYHNHLE